MFEHHNYEEGCSYSVSEIDSGDSTLRARDENGSLAEPQVLERLNSTLANLLRGAITKLPT